MKKNNKFVKSCLVVVLFLALAAIATVIAFLFMRNVQNRRITANLPPTVLVNMPVNGESVPAGETVEVLVSAAAQYPISRIELWLDSVLVETQMPDPTQGEVITFYAFSYLQIAEGTHIFSARAVDANGLVGQSLPIFIQGDPLPETMEVTVEEGQTLQDIANATGSDGDLLKEINPGLGDGALPGGSKVVVPAPGGSNPPADNGPAGQPPAPLPLQPPIPFPPQPNGIIMLPISGPIIDIGSLIPILFSNVPKAPTNLKAGYENCRIRLLWMDNADIESHFIVWMQALGGPPKVIATLDGSPRTGPAWYEFDSPQTGIYSFWIEAVNAIGGQSSEIAWVAVTDLNCGSGLATHLNIETLDMFINGAFDRVYCYLSVEGAPEKRIPSNESQFIPVQSGWGDVSNWTGSGSSFLLPEPMDNEVTLEGTCLGWRGANGPVDLGTFSASAAKETWDGRRLELKGDGFTIGYRIQPNGPGAANGSFTYIDYSLPLPFKPWITTETSTDPVENDKMARRPTLHWMWIGDQNRLTGFTLILNGKPVQSVPDNSLLKTVNWQKEILLPTSCGGVYQLEVAANSGQAMSALSMGYEYVQPPCEQYAEVTFETFTFTYMDDGDPPCDTAQVYYEITLFDGFEKISSGLGSWFDTGMGSTNYTKDMSCGTYLFSDYPTTKGYTFLVPIDHTQNPTIGISMSFHDSDFLMDDLLCAPYNLITMPYQSWPTYSERLTTVCRNSDIFPYDADGYITYTVKGVSAPDTYPRSADPGIGQPIGP